MPPGVHPHPGGMLENSPTFQRWVQGARGTQVPKGRLRPLVTSAVPSGLVGLRELLPNAGTLDYIGCPSGTGAWFPMPMLPHR
jgi:hypothetical protein